MKYTISLEQLDKITLAIQDAMCGMFVDNPCGGYEYHCPTCSKKKPGESHDANCDLLLAFNELERIEAGASHERKE